VVKVMTLAAALIYWVIVAIWLAVLGAVAWFYISNPKIFGTTRVLLTVIAIDTFRNIVENVYFGLYFDSRYGLFDPGVATVLGQPLLLIGPKVLNILSGVMVLSILLLRWLPQAIRERRSSEEQTRHLSRMAATDGMTGLFNRSHFLLLAETEFERAQRYERPLSLLLLDIDRFKSINDRFGHDVGDQVIIEIAGILRFTAREADLTGRLGGEEFVMLLPETALADAAILAERLRSGVAVAPIRSTGGDVHLTASIGVAGTLGNGSFGEMMKKADLALYAAKHGGRDQVRLMPMPADGVSPLLQAGGSGR
jgi:diguanylate cyclase (GGDEF)-like protein